MHLRILIGLVVLLLALATASLAQESDRYRLERTDNGLVRMDTVTGEMSICQDRDGRLVCRMLGDERAAFEQELERLQASVEALEKRVSELEAARPGDEGPSQLSESEFEQTMSYMERFFRRFIGIVKDLDQELRKDESEPAQPQRT